MPHHEDICLVPGADTAVLFIHGICGTPAHFRELIPLVEQVPENWSVYNLLLDGHGGSVKDFGFSSMEKWKGKVQAVFEDLAGTHEKVILVGHSMGTLFALQLAAEYPEKVPLLFLLAVPLRPWLKPSMVVDLLAMVFGSGESQSPRRMALIRAAGIKTTRKLWAYIPWIPRFLELFREIIRTEQILDRLQSPCICFQSQKDELVLRRTEKLLMKQSIIQLVRLNDSSHFYYSPADRERVLRMFCEQMKKRSHD